MERLTKITAEGRAEFFSNAQEGSYYTIVGAGGEAMEWTEGYDGMLADCEVGRPLRYYLFTGADMNEHYGLTGDNAYQPGLIFISFPLDGLKVHRLALFRLVRGDSWFDDIVANNARRQAENGRREREIHD